MNQRDAVERKRTIPFYAVILGVAAATAALNIAVFLGLHPLLLGFGGLTWLILMFVQFFAVERISRERLYGSSIRFGMAIGLAVAAAFAYWR